MQILFQYNPDTASAPAAFFTALQDAATYLDGLIQNDITITIEVGWGETGAVPNASTGTPIAANDLASAAPYGNVLTYAQVVAGLTDFATSIDDLSVLKYLPAVDPTNGGGFLVSIAQQEAWGLLPADHSTGTVIGGVVGFSDADPFSFDPNNRATATTFDFIGTAEHEITHALGRFGSDESNPVGLDFVMDLFRYTAPGVLATSTTQNAYFSLDGGQTEILPFDNSVTGDPGDWTSAVEGDSFGYGRMDQLETVSAADIRLMDVLGFNVGAAGVSAGKSAPIISNVITSALSTVNAGSVSPFAGVEIQDSYVGSPETLNVTLASSNGVEAGTLSDSAGGTFDSVTGIFTATGTVSASGEDFAQSILDQLVYNAPANLPAGLSLTITVTNGAGSAETGPLQIVQAPASAAPVSNDFNGDGKSDILWQSDSGAVVEWLMNGVQPTAEAVIGGDGTWSVAGTGDFNGDGKSDILWRSTSGTVVEWQMNGSQPTAEAAIGGSSNWSIAGTGDFNGDGKTDILWTDLSGGVVEWQMNGLRPTSMAFIGGSSDWKVVGTGDFNGDGKTDILWQNTSGAVAMWTMNGTQVTGSAIIGGSSDWSVAGTGDFNGDGKTDILWQDQTGDVSMWMMNGSQVVSSAVISGPSDWRVAGTGDYSGDGKSDILWRNSSTGAVSIWTMNGSQVVSTATIGGDANWKPVTV